MNKSTMVIIGILVVILGFLTIYSQQHDTVAQSAQAPGAAAGYGSKAASGGYGAKTAAGGYGASALRQVGMAPRLPRPAGMALRQFPRQVDMALRLPRPADTALRQFPRPAGMALPSRAGISNISEYIS